MRCSTPCAEPDSLSALIAAPDFARSASEAIHRISMSTDDDEALMALTAAAGGLGARSACFLGFVRDDALHTSFRYLIACDPRWASRYVHERWFTDDPWLLHALRSTLPVRASELAPASAAQQTVVGCAEQAGFRSAVIVPVQSAAGDSRVAALYLGSGQPGFFEDPGFATLRLFARMLAAELHDWWLRRIRAEQLAQARITETDLELLRRQALGQSSKTIAAALHTEPQRIDCHFQRITTRLGTASRRDAVRLARLYGLI